ncbi:MAG TPA: prepilin-type N-terminal cleavage/methylation domain-containing protein [Chthoniobacteraceae bacterium]|jgi:prepilin-type processing-associated H-X9-DG protein/prepilin-type N-terminal cleavage/methylation domain-containing protein
MFRGAFTLLELLVVLAVITVLGTLILSATHIVKEKAQSAQCVSNLRQLAAANLAHAAENNGQFVQAQERENLIRWHGIRSGATEAFNAEKGPLAPYLGTEARVKLCPAFRDALKDSESFEESTGGYGYNALYIGGTPADRFRAERMSNVPRPANTVMFTDTAFARARGIQEYAYSEPFRSTDSAGRLRGALSPSVHFRHHDRANVAWCDGHVSGESFSALGKLNSYGGDSAKWKIGWFGPNGNNGYWNPHAELVTDPDQAR